MDVVILAGGETPPALAESLDAAVSTERALIEVNGRPCIAYLLDSLTAVEGLGKIIVVGRPATLDALPGLMHEAIGVKAGETLVANILAGAAVASTEELLLCTCDIPLVTPPTWGEFFARVQANSLEAAYPIVRKETVEKQFPGGKRTYATLVDGTFTGGNAFVLPRAQLGDLKQVIDAAYQARKNPLAIARILGVKFVVKAVLKKLTILDLEQKMSQVLKCRAGAVEMPDASIAFDVDKPDDFQLAQKLLSKKSP